MYKKFSSWKFHMDGIYFINFEALYCIIKYALWYFVICIYTWMCKNIICHNTIHACNSNNTLNNADLSSFISGGFFFFFFFWTNGSNRRNYWLHYSLGYYSIYISHAMNKSIWCQLLNHRNDDHYSTKPVFIVLITVHKQYMWVVRNPIIWRVTEKVMKMSIHW